MTIPPTRVSHDGAAIGPKLSVITIAGIAKQKATHVSFHSNRIRTLEVPVRSAKVGRDVAVVFTENCLESVIDLDLSSNALHEGCELSRFSSPSRYSLLSMTPGLTKLNIASNGLDEKSLCSLICIKKPSGISISLLPCLRQLDISHNNISKLPADLNEIFPALSELKAMNNQLGSLTDLLQVLHSFKGRLESIHLRNRCSTQNNPVCHKRFYREKIIFILGNNLRILDGAKVKSEERAYCRLTLSQDYQIDVSTEYQRHMSQHEDELFDYSGRDEYLDESASRSQSVESDCNAERMSQLELQVASLSAIVEKQAKTLLEASKDHDNPNEFKNAITQTEENTQEDTLQLIARRQRSALAQAVLRIIFIKRRHKNTHLLLAFYHWKLQVASSSNMKEARRKWQEQTITATKREAEKCQEKLSLSKKAEQVAHNKVVELTSTINQLQHCLEAEGDGHRVSKQADTATINSLRAAITKQDEAHSQLVNQLRVDMESLAAELRSVKENLSVERSKVERLESSKRLTSKETEETVASCKTQVEEMRLEAVRKETAIRQLKEAFESVATKAAADRSKAEQACLAERQAKDLLHKHNRRISELEDDVERLKSTRNQLETTIANHEQKSKSLTQDIEMKSFTIANMRTEIDELKSVINEKDGRIQSAIDEYDETQRQFKECRRSKTRLEERNSMLQSQLDRLQDEMRSSNDQLQQSLDKHRRESKEREAELQRKYREQRALENSFHQEIATLQKKLKKAQSVSRQKEQLVDRHRLEMKEAKDAFEQEATSLRSALDKERVLCREAETRATELEASQYEQRARMQKAIESLTKQLTMGTPTI